MNKKYTIIIGVISVLIIASLALIPKQDATGNVIKKNTITIPAILPLTGSSATLAQYNQEGIELALEEINTKGGVNGREFKVVYEDSTSNTKNAVTSLQQLLSTTSHEVFILGASSPETLAQAPILKENRVVGTALGSAANDIRFAGDYIFRLKASVAQEMEFITRIARKKMSAEKMFILYVKNNYGQSIKESASELFVQGGGEIVGTAGFSIDQKEYKTELLKAKQADSDVILIGGWPKNTGWIVKEAEELGITAQFISGAGGVGPEVTRIAGGAANGIIYPSEFNIENQNPITQNFVSRFENKYDHEPDFFAAMGYDIIHLYADIFEECNGVEAECVKEELYSTKNFTGASGVISFDEYGDIQRDFTLMTIRNNSFEVY